jgi:hypothetical protein
MSIANAARADAHTSDTRRGAVPDAPQVVCVLDADPDLAVGLDQNQIQSARRHSVARVMSFERGPFSFRSPDEGLGALILEGLILVRVEFAGIRANVELLGPGDVISPWLGMGTAPTPPAA